MGNSFQHKNIILRENIETTSNYSSFFVQVFGMSPSISSSLTSLPLLATLPVAPPDPRLLDPVLQSSVSSDASENTVIAAKNENTESWANTFESNFTNTSVDEPKYAKVNHKKRNSKIASGNSTPKTKRRKPSESRLSRLIHIYFQIAISKLYHTGNYKSSIISCLMTL